MGLVDDKYRKEKDYVRVYSILVECAESRATIEYGEIAQMLGRKLGNAFANWIGNVLCAITEDEHASGRPLLTALAVSKKDGMPNKAFFQFARDIRVYDGNSKDEDIIFWAKETIRVFKAWRE